MQLEHCLLCVWDVFPQKFNYYFLENIFLIFLNILIYYIKNNFLKITNIILIYFLIKNILNLLHYTNSKTLKILPFYQTQINVINEVKKDKPFYPKKDQ